MKTLLTKINYIFIIIIFLCTNYCKLFAADITVTTLLDNETVDGNVSLREAIEAAETDSSVDGSTAGNGADRIIFAPTLFSSGDADISLTLFDTGTDSGEFGPTAFIITTPITILGPDGDNGITIKLGSGEFRLFHVTASGTLKIINISLEKGMAQGGDGGEGGAGGGGAAGLGGAIFNENTLIISKCTLSENQAIGGEGYNSSGSNSGSGGGGVGEDGSNGSSSGGAGGGPNGGIANGGAGGSGGGGGGGNRRSAAGPGSAGDGGDAGFGGGGGGGGYCLSTGGSPPSPDATAGDGGDGGFGGGAGGGGTAWSWNGADNPGTRGDAGYGGGAGTDGIVGDNQPGGDGGGGAGFGGAIFNRGGFVSVDNSTFSGNSVSGGDCGENGDGDGQGGCGYGGAIMSRNGSVIVSNTTFAGNATFGGEGMTKGTAFGGGIFCLGDAGTALLRLYNSIVADSTGGIFDLVVGINNGGTIDGDGSGNLIELNFFFSGGVVTNADPMLMPLADNRGPTKTHALKAGSPAIDLGNTSAAAGSFDQRGTPFARVADGDMNGSPIVDIGSYEFIFIDYGDAPDTGAGTGAGTAFLNMGESSFRISIMGDDSEADSGKRQNYSAYDSDVAYNAIDNEFLVVWRGIDNTAPLTNNESEIFGVRINAKTGSKIGNQFRISVMGTDSESDPAIRDDFAAYYPAVAWNSTDNQYLVVWSGDDDTPPLVDGENEVFGQRLNNTGGNVGSRIRISFMGPNSDTDYRGDYPDIAYNATANEYMVAWKGEDTTAPLVDNEYEIYGQRVNAAGILQGTKIRVSTQGNEAEIDPNIRIKSYASDPKVAWNSSENLYLIVWSGDSDVPPLIDGENEIFGQVLNSSGGEIGSDFRVSHMGTDATNLYRASNPDIVYNSAENQFLIVWFGDDNSSPLVNDENEIFGQIVNGTGAVSVSQFRISNMGIDGVTTYAAYYPATAYNPIENSYLVVWYGDNTIDNKMDIFAQRLNSSGVEIGVDTLIGTGGDDDDPGFDQGSPAVAFGVKEKQYLTVWHGDDDTPPLIDGEREIHGQFTLEANVINYNTTSSDNGPSHSGRNGLHIGLLLDSEADGAPSIFADGDDLTETDDEDGINSSATTVILNDGEALSVTVSVENTIGSAASLYGWVDYNTNGVFDNSTERASVSVPNGTSGNVILNFPVFPADTYNTYARFRLSTDPAAANSTGPATDGEVEDYSFSITYIPEPTVLLIFYLPFILLGLRTLPSHRKRIIT